jgi:hypothetical protein
VTAPRGPPPPSRPTPSPRPHPPHPTPGGAWDPAAGACAPAAKVKATCAAGIDVIVPAGAAAAGGALRDVNDVENDPEPDVSEGEDDDGVPLVGGLAPKLAGPLLDVFGAAAGDAADDAGDDDGGGLLAPPGLLSGLLPLPPLPLLGGLFGGPSGGAGPLGALLPPGGPAVGGAKGGMRMTMMVGHLEPPAGGKGGKGDGEPQVVMQVFERSFGGPGDKPATDAESKAAAEAFAEAEKELLGPLVRQRRCWTQGSCLASCQRRVGRLRPKHRHAAHSSLTWSRPRSRAPFPRPQLGGPGFGIKDPLLEMAKDLEEA